MATHDYERKLRETEIGLLELHADELKFVLHSLNQCERMIVLWSSVASMEGDNMITTEGKILTVDEADKHICNTLRNIEESLGLIVKHRKSFERRAETLKKSLGNLVH